MTHIERVFYCLCLLHYKTHEELDKELETATGFSLSALRQKNTNELTRIEMKKISTFFSKHLKNKTLHTENGCPILDGMALASDLDYLFRDTPPNIQDHAYNSANKTKKIA